MTCDGARVAHAVLLGWLLICEACGLCETKLLMLLIKQSHLTDMAPFVSYFWNSVQLCLCFHLTGFNIG